jgi:hypothetical protein
MLLAHTTHLFRTTTGARRNSSSPLWQRAAAELMILAQNLIVTGDRNAMFKAEFSLDALFMGLQLSLDCALHMDFFSAILKRPSDAGDQVKDSKERIARTNADEESGGKYFQSSGDESNANDHIEMRTQMQNLPEVAFKFSQQ